MLFLKNIPVNIYMDIKIILAKIEKSTTSVFLFVTSFVLLLLGQSIFLASINFFRLIPVLIACVISIIVSSIFLYFIREDIHLFPKVSFMMILVLVLISLILIFYPHDNFGGTDNGSYINLAFYLEKNGSFDTPSYLNGLPPGIEIIKKSLPSYRIWLATQKTLFGTPIAIRGNLLIIILGLLSFFSVASTIKDRRMGIMSVTLFATSMPFLWFSRETMNENLIFFLLWTSFFFLIVFFKTKKRIFIAYLILTLFLMSYTRPEGIFISLFTLFAFIFLASYKKILSKKKLLLIVTTGLLLIITLFFIVFKSSYYANVSSSIVNSIKNIISNINYLFIGRPFLLQKYTFFYSQMLIKYNFFLIMLFIFIILFQQLFFSGNRNSKKIYFFALVIIILPECAKLIDPGIQILQPWFYRRYLYALLPLGYLSLSLFLSNLRNKKVSIVIFYFFIITNLLFSYPIIFLKHNWTLYAAMKEIDNVVSPKDLIIIRNEKILGYYYPQYYFMLQKSIRAIYTFDVNDKELSLENKTYKGIPFKALFYLTDAANDFYNDYPIIDKQIINVNFTQLKPSCELEHMAQQNNIKEYYLIPYSVAINYCKYPSNEIVKFNKQLYLYQLN